MTARKATVPKMSNTLHCENYDLPSGLTSEVILGGSGPPLVYLHSANGVSPADPFLQALSEHYSIYAPVAPGYNDLDELHQMRTVHDVVLHYDDVFQVLELDSFVMAGQSFGGMFAAEFAAHYPKRISKLALLAPVGMWDDNIPAVDMFATPPLELDPLLWADPTSEVANAAREAMLGGDDPVESTISLMRGLITVGKFLMPIPDRGLHRRLYRISAPTLVLWGEQDGLVPVAYADLFTRGIAGSKKSVLPDCGHLITLERTEEAMSQVMRHFSA